MSAPSEVYVDLLEKAAREAVSLLATANTADDPSHFVYARDVLSRALAASPTGKAQPTPAKPRNPISTRRVDDGTVHEMADRGAGTLCGRDLPEPWTWTDDPVNCEGCLAALEGRDGS